MERIIIEIEQTGRTQREMKIGVTTSETGTVVEKGVAEFMRRPIAELLAILIKSSLAQKGIFGVGTDDTMEGALTAAEIDKDIQSAGE